MREPIKPKFEPRERRASNTWYVLVTWGDRPPEQCGGFGTKEQAEAWIKEVSANWAKGQSTNHLTGRL